MDVLRSKTGLYLSPLAITNVNEAMARFNASATALQKKQGMLAMGQNAAMAAMQMHEDAENEFWRLNQGDSKADSNSEAGRSNMRTQVQQGFNQLVLELVRLLACP